MTTSPPLQDGAYYYNPLSLRFYDAWVLWLSNSYAWLCPTAEVLLPFFRENMSANHLDVGVGTGYFPTSSINTTAQKASQHITLVDLNPDSLEVAKQRIISAHPHVSVSTVIADATKRQPPPLEGKKFQSISAFYLLHCLPGNPPEKKNDVFKALRPHLAEDGVFVGATLLGKVSQMNWFAWALLNLYNRLGIFSNWEDEASVFEKGLRAEFQEVETWIVGRVFMFRARKPKQE